MTEAFDIRTVNRATLKDISSVEIDMSLPVDQRIDDYLEQIGNPYCYKDGKMVVGIGFVNTDATLKEKLAVCANGL